LLSRLSMIGKILGSGELGKLASFVSPAFFDVMPARVLWKQARTLYAQTRDHEAFRHAVAERAAQLAQTIPQITLLAPGAPAPKSNGAAAVGGDASARAQNVVQLYFQQLFHGGTTLLDLRRSAFNADGEQLLWRPAAWMINWAPDFIEPLRDLYRGFYAHDDVTFRQGLAALSLSHSEDLFRTQFGGDQAQVQFRTVDFIRVFHQVFLRCKEHGTALHPDFLPLGIYLAALYDHLEELAVPVDVAKAYHANLNSNPNPETAHA
jgi:hypothetical protein